MTHSPHSAYPDLDPSATGARGLCPRCGEGKLFKGLDVRENCSVCGLDFAFEDSGDGPVVFILLGLGFVILGGAVYLELTYGPPLWLHVLLWPPLVFGFGIPLLRATKGYLIAQQYKTDASSGRLAGKKDQR
ncbi:DUF983 domain-containing protein [Pseudahrensia aquimaris]|uniref:DUF983 domain-containing protein n=1 Tax=Pseudahrensia aquimaris TaxID=744461 RepID=A0ABW3FHW4_9HYPH